MLQSDTDEFVCQVSVVEAQEGCSKEGNARWYYFVATSLVILIGGGFLIFCLQLLYDKWNQIKSQLSSDTCSQISRRMFPNYYDRDKLDEVELHNKLRHYIVNEVISLQTNKGMVLAILYFLFNVISVTLYINQSDQPLEQCVDVLNTCNWTLYADIGLNVFFLFHFLLRLIAAPNRLKFWFQMGSIVDFCTIPPCALALILKRNWLGMRFMRALRFMQMGEILMTFNSTGTSVDVRGGNRSNLKKAAKNVNDARFTKVKDPVKTSKDPRFSKVSSSKGASDPKSSGVRQKMGGAARKTDSTQGAVAKKAVKIGDHDGPGYLDPACMCKRTAYYNILSSPA